MQGTYYISAIRLSKDKNGIEFISHARVHSSFGGVINRQGTVYPKNLILDMMRKNTFFTAIWDIKKKKWKLGAIVMIYLDENGEQYIVTNSEDETDLYRLKTC